MTLLLHNTVHDTTPRQKPEQAWCCRMSGACMLTSSRSGAAADSGDRETDRGSWCCSESGRCILGLFVPPVTWCHCDLCCTRCIPYGQLGSDKKKRVSHKPQIVSSFQIKHCCLSKKNELKIRAISILVPKKEKKKKPHSQITGSPSSLIELWQQQPSHFSCPSLPRLQSERMRIVCPKKSLIWPIKKLF